MQRFHLVIARRDVHLPHNLDLFDATRVKVSLSRAVTFLLQTRYLTVLETVVTVHTHTDEQTEQTELCTHTHRTKQTRTRIIQHTTCSAC